MSCLCCNRIQPFLLRVVYYSTTSSPSNFRTVFFLPSRYSTDKQRCKFCSHGLLYGTNEASRRYHTLLDILGLVFFNIIAPARVKKLTKGLAPRAPNRFCFPPLFLRFCRPTDWFALQTFGPPSLMQLNNKEATYASILRGVKKEARITKGVFFAGVIPLLAICARKLIGNI